MDFNFIFDPTVITGCCVLGYLLKNSFESFPNRQIPLTLALTGIFIYIGLRGISIENVVSGAVMGLASVGLHQNFVKYIEGIDKYE